MSSCSVLRPQQRATLQARIQAELARRGLQAPVPYTPRGAAAVLQASQAPQIVISGPAGTGKSRACLEKLRRLAQEVPRLRALIVRKTRVSLTESALLTFEQTVLGPSHPLVIGGPQRAFRRAYDYPNGSSLVVGGLDNPTKLMSTEYDLIYVQEATELSENDWEALSTRLRNGRLPYQHILGDCNPDAPTRWLRRRHETGQTPMLESRHEDNPRLHDGRDWTAEGRAYMSVLEALTGVRLQHSGGRVHRGAGPGCAREGPERRPRLARTQDAPAHGPARAGHGPPLTAAPLGLCPASATTLCRMAREPVFARPRS